MEPTADGSVECVVLNACFSKVQAQAIATHVNYVIGMEREIEDRSAMNFAVAFYDTLAAGGDVEEAFKLGCSQLLGIAEHLTPQLLKNDRSRGANFQSETKVEFKLQSQRVNYTQLHNLLAAHGHVLMKQLLLSLNEAIRIGTQSFTLPFYLAFDEVFDYMNKFNNLLSNSSDVAT